MEGWINGKGKREREGEETNLPSFAVSLTLFDVYSLSFLVSSLNHYALAWQCHITAKYYVDNDNGGVTHLYGYNVIQPPGKHTLMVTRGVEVHAIL